MNKLFGKIYKWLDKKFNPVWDMYILDGEDVDFGRACITFDTKPGDKYEFNLEVQHIDYIEHRDVYAVQLDFYHSEHDEHESHEDLFFVHYIPKWGTAYPANDALNYWKDKYALLFAQWEIESEIQRLKWEDNNL